MGIRKALICWFFHRWRHWQYSGFMNEGWGEDVYCRKCGKDWSV